MCHTITYYMYQHVLLSITMCYNPLPCVIIIPLTTDKTGCEVFILSIVLKLNSVAYNKQHYKCIEQNHLLHKYTDPTDPIILAGRV